MRKLVVLVVLLSQAAFAAESVQRSVCVPDTPESKNWPVKAIYMHGLLPFSGDSGTYPGLEAEARQKLAEWATKHKFRVAVPLSEKSGSYQGGTYRVWDGASLSSVEAQAKKACGGRLDSPRALIGFSRGAYQSIRLTPEACSSGNYSNAISIGAPGAHVAGGTNACAKVQEEHNFPKAAKNFDQTLSKTIIGGDTSSSNSGNNGGNR